jgi:hypothetical protein
MSGAARRSLSAKLTSRGTAPSQVPDFSTGLGPKITDVTWIDLVGWGGSVLLVWSLLQTRILRLRVWNLIGCLVLIVFNAWIHVWPMVGLNVVLALINIWYLLSLSRTRHDEAAFAVVEVGVEGELLAHAIRLHAADIARFNPGFHWPVDARGRTAFLVVSGDETVGVVIIRPDADDPTIARVELDYVTPRFRDFTPGEFVYRRSRMFSDRGFRTVISPPGMIAPYYARLGFRRAGDAYSLTVDPADG